MNFKFLKRNELNEEQLPDSIYKSVVSLLYSDSKFLAIGITCCMIAAVVLFLKINDPAQLIFASLIFFIGSVRLLLAKSFHEAVLKRLSIQTYKAWESKYNLMSGIYVVVLVAWYANGLIRSADPYVQLLTFAVILCYFFGVLGRNFASNKVVRWQVFIAGPSLILCTALFDQNNGLYSLILAVFLVPFFATVYYMSTRLRGMLFNAEINALNNRTIANRFDVALDNVTHGIAMIDKDGMVVVANERFIHLAGMDDWEIIGCKISILNTVEISGTPYASLGEQIKSFLVENTSAQVSVTLNSGVVIEAEYNSMIDGGVVVLSDVSERKASEKAIIDLANFDPLTNLSNRRHFVENVETYISSNEDENLSSMYFIDLDNFKEVNDTLGHSVGDELLRVVAHRLKLLIADDAMICRFGGDEFVIFYPKLYNVEECANFANVVLKELNLPVVIGNNQIDIGGSIGIAISPDHGKSADSLLQYADAALYDSKAKGRSIYTFYTSALGDTLREKRDLETDLRRAIINDEIDLHYQPIFDVKKCTIGSCEALARWEHPTLGNISPGVFVELAEETGLIVPLGKTLLKKAMLECLNWPEDIRVAVNFSSIQFQRSDVYKTVKTLLKETGLPPQKLIIEVTESVMISNIEEITKTLIKLSKMGVYISLDDFGTGFSSLSYLHTLPFDKVKIDKSFVDNGIASERSLILLQGVVDLIKRLGLSVVLEGIETQEQLDIMEKSISVDEYQGYLFFKPMKAHDVLSLMDKMSHVYSRERVSQLVG